MYCHFSNIEILEVMDQFPRNWTQFFRSQTVSSSKRILTSEETGPDFIAEFVRQRNAIVQNFENEFIEQIQLERNEKLHPNITRGMSPKKIHEVLNFGDFLLKRLNKSDQRLIDVGSGAGHLERYLLSLIAVEIICIESSKTQTQSATKWAQKQRGCENQNKTVRTVNATLENSSECFSTIEKQLGDETNTKRGLLCGLHSCGELTNSMISWYLSTSRLSELAVISCCYHKMKAFPISQHIKDMIQKCPEASSITSTYSLRLAAQDPFTAWLNKSTDGHMEHANAFGKRAVLHKATKTFGFHLKKNTFSSYHNLTISDIMTEVDKQHNFEDESKRDELIENVNEELNQDFNWIEIFSGFQAFLQLPLEFLVIIDKILFIRENEPSKNPKLLRIFDATISPRCFLLHCN